MGKKLEKIFEEFLNETQSLDELFIKGFKLCIKAENLIIDAIVNANKPFQLNEADNTDINTITDNISIESIQDANRLITHINTVINALDLRADAIRTRNIAAGIPEERINIHFINDPDEVNLAYHQFIQNIQNARQELNNENIERIMGRIEKNLRELITSKQNELADAERRLIETYNTYSTNNPT